MHGHPGRGGFGYAGRADWLAWRVDDGRLGKEFISLGVARCEQETADVVGVRLGDGDDVDDGEMVRDECLQAYP